MNASVFVKKRIKIYQPKGNLGHTASLFLEIASVNHCSTKTHCENVALLSEMTAKKIRKDSRASFFAGLLHDFAKILLPAELFDGHNIDDAEYVRIKTHARAGFVALKKLHLFTALCAGLHHNMADSGYGLSVNDIPGKWSPQTVKKVMEIATIVSVCDFVDAFVSRKTGIRDGSDKVGHGLKTMLYAKYPNDQLVVDIALESLKELFPELANKA